MRKVFQEEPGLKTAQTVLASYLELSIDKQAFELPYTEIDRRAKRMAYQALCDVLSELEDTYRCWAGNSHQSAQDLVFSGEDFATLIERAQARLARTWIGSLDY